MASPRDQRLRKLVIDSNLPVRERREAMHSMTAPSRKWLRKLIADTATPPQLRSAADAVLEKIEASRKVKRRPVEQVATEQAPAQSVSVPGAMASPASVADLLAQSKAARTLADVDYQAVHAYCAARGWSSQAHEVFAAWRKTHFATDDGRAAAIEIMRRLREHDFEAWKNAADDWRDSGWKDGRRLIEVLERIVASPSRGNYHSGETVAGARQLLAEIKKRCA